jgi:hypothetical protein
LALKPRYSSYRGIFIYTFFMNDIKLWLDDYDDIYSDFDSRHYQKRRISDDFLYELQNEVKLITTPTKNIQLLLPKTMRNEVSERIIASGLNEYFKKQYFFHQKKCKQKLQNGIRLLMLGTIVMLFNTWLSNYFKASFHIIFLRILLEPAGWFLLWAAFDFLFYDFKKLKTERNFFYKMSKTIINFSSAT